MKKSCFALLVLLLCLVCSLALADSKYIGTWMHYQVTGMNSRQYVVYEFNENGKAYYSNETFAYDGSSSVNTAVYSWRDTGDIVQIIDGSELFKELYYVDGTRLSSSSFKNTGFYYRVLGFYDDESALNPAEVTAEPEPTSEPLPPVVVNDNDLSCLSFDELVSLREQLNLAIWNCQEWQEVTVPSGTWIIGEDIPAAHWTLRVAAKHDSFNVFYFDTPDEFGKGVGYGSKLLNYTIATSDFSPFGEIPVTEIDIEMHEGWYLYLGGAAIFTPYAGKPDLGFK